MSKRISTLLATLLGLTLSLSAEAEDIDVVGIAEDERAAIGPPTRASRRCGDS